MTTVPSGRTVLVTGGGGFVGSHLVDALCERNDVRVIDDFSTGARENVAAAADVVEGDVRDGETLRRAMDGVDLVFHEAAIASVRRSVERPVESHEINLDATVELLEAARREDARVVLASSCAIYGRPEEVPLREETPTRPTSPYAIQKLALDQYARQYHERYGLETVPLRYFNVYGPRQPATEYSGVIGIFVDRALSGDPLTVHGDGEQTRDFVHVSDVVRANLLAATTDRIGEAFNVGTGESVTIRALAETVVEATDSDSEIVHTGAREGDIRRSEADISRARRALGYEPTTSLSEGLATLVDDADG
ncbi:MAG: NAD-dependent epimerase/dehydratase family protein [Salinigranum sp.]